MTIPLVDLFAGPGGLNEGFASLGGTDPAFQTLASFEMDPAACQTLRLRATYRRLLRAGTLSPYYRLLRGQFADVDEACRRDGAFAAAWEEAQSEIHEVELGIDRDVSDSAIRRALEGYPGGRPENWVLVGGPPCQAYSLAGRSRRIKDIHFEEDKKHFLYREYLHILGQFEPAVFVMENVKGLLSSKHSGRGMFEQILADLRHPSSGSEYVIYSLVSAAEPDQLAPEDFIIRAEEHGVPQRRHRVILLGIRADLAPAADSFQRLLKTEPRQQATVRQVIGGMPPIRSGVSKTKDDDEVWAQVHKGSARKLGRMCPDDRSMGLGLGASWLPTPARVHRNRRLASWLQDARLGGVIQHEARRHMLTDLQRYMWAADFAASESRSPTLADFPPELLPDHRNATATSVPFGDRFRVQVWDQPSTTVVSHIAKDGHYYIHPDPCQMRSLTVREAARLQTFPDNYYFMGNRTDQYTQVGNAVPPLLANQIAEIVHEILQD